MHVDILVRNSGRRFKHVIFRLINTFKQASYKFTSGQTGTKQSWTGANDFLLASKCGWSLPNRSVYRCFCLFAILFAILFCLFVFVLFFFRICFIDGLISNVVGKGVKYSKNVLMFGCIPVIMLKGNRIKTHVVVKSSNTDRIAALTAVFL